MDKIILNRIVQPYNMAKELGQIHTVNDSTTFNAGLAEQNTPLVISNIDLPGQLTSQLQRMVRAGNYFKVVGIDINLGLDQDLNQSFEVAGEIRYYAPTRGRCEAFRSAFKAMADAMSLQGVSMRDNVLYDFRAPLNPTPTGPSAVPFPNQAVLDGSESIGLSLNDPINEGVGIFQVHNEGVRPVYEGSDIYSQGFRTLLDGGDTRTDFVLNDVAPYTGNHMIASTEYETIPFQLAFTTSGLSSSTATFQFRPDPALYLAIMCGQMQVVINDMDVGTATPIGGEQVSLNVAVMVSGWKSIMGNPDKKKRSSKKKSSKKTGK